VQNKLRHILLSKNNYDKLCHCTTGETFVTRKITRAVAKIHLGLQDEVNSTCSDKNWNVASLMLHPLPNKILGNDMRNDGSYLARTWEWYGWVNSYLGDEFCHFCGYEKCMEWKLLFCQDMDKILNKKIVTLLGSNSDKWHAGLEMATWDSKNGEKWHKAGLRMWARQRKAQIQ